MITSDYYSTRAEKERIKLTLPNAPRPTILISLNCERETSIIIIIIIIILLLVCLYAFVTHFFLTLTN